MSPIVPVVLFCAAMVVLALVGLWMVILVSRHFPSQSEINRIHCRIEGIRREIEAIRVECRINPNKEPTP